MRRIMSGAGMNSDAKASTAGLGPKRTPEPPAKAAGDLAVDTLARTIWGEARGELVRGKEAVAAVVMNRVRRAKERGGYWWGSTPVEVCRRPWQFSCWNETDPNRKKIESVNRDDRNFQTCLRIARRALAGTLKDPTGGATHYHAKNALPPWARGRKPSAEIGGHKFYNDVE